MQWYLSHYSLAGARRTIQQNALERCEQATRNIPNSIRVKKGWVHWPAQMLHLH